MFAFRKIKNRGFTIVELLIVIVVIGILALLVITTYNGIQEKARDTKRKTDINALQGQIEAYEAENGNYPTLGNINDTSWRATNMKGLDPTALQDPKWSSSNANCTDTSVTPNVAIMAGSVKADCYTYTVTPSGCDNSTTDCTGYTLSATLESDGSTYSKQNLN